METKGADQLWERYVEKTKGCNIPPNSIRWYVKRVEDYLRVHSELNLHQHSAEHADNYLQALGRNTRLQDWQFRQVVDALRIFFVDLLDIQWAAAFPWTFRIESSKPLPDNHATVARDYLPWVLTIN